ncbi:UNVERIFIED_ORG: hypothetical protein BDU10_3105 [Burkholderia sp. CF145]
MVWYDGLYGAIQGLGSSDTVGNATPSFTSDVAATLTGPTSGTTVKNATPAPSQLPVFSMPGQAGGSIGANAYDTSGIGSNFSTSDMLRLGMAGANTAQGKGGILGGFNPAQLSAAQSDPTVAGVGDLASMASSAFGQQQASQQQQQAQLNAFAAKSRAAAAKAMQTPMVAVGQPPRPVNFVGAPGVLAGGFGNGITIR